MEINDLKNFFSVAVSENVNGSARELGLSPGTLSKSIAKLEDELGVSLFYRVGRNIRLSEAGARLKVRASEIVSLEERARFELAGNPSLLRLQVAGPELLLQHFGISLLGKLRRKFGLGNATILPSQDELVFQKVRDGEAHFGITTVTSAGLHFNKLTTAKFRTFVGPGHPFFAVREKKKSMNIAEVLKQDFVVPTSKIVGALKSAVSADGWRDDKFPRRVTYRTDSLKVLESLVMTGQAIAYLPDFYGDALGARAIEVDGCPYHCQQTIYVVCRDPSEYGWLNSIL